MFMEKHAFVCIYIYIYIYRERERERMSTDELNMDLPLQA